MEVIPAIFRKRSPFPRGLLRGLRAALVGRKRTQESLRRSEELYHELVASVRDYAIILLDPRGFVTSWNAGAEDIKGWAAHVRKFGKSGRDVYVYFNNDQHGHAPANAQLLQEILKLKRLSRGNREGRIRA